MQRGFLDISSCIFNHYRIWSTRQPECWCRVNANAAAQKEAPNYMATESIHRCNANTRNMRIKGATLLTCRRTWGVVRPSRNSTYLISEGDTNHNSRLSWNLCMQWATTHIGSCHLHGGSICSLGYFPFQPVIHNWSIKECGMCCPVCGKVHIKDPLWLIGKSSLCGDSGFPLQKYVTMTICLMFSSWYENQWALEASLNKNCSLVLVTAVRGWWLWKSSIRPFVFIEHGA